MLQELKRRENLYLIPLMAIILDWGSTVIAMQYNSRFVELNPIGQMLGLKGVAFDLDVVSVVQFVLFGVDDLHQCLPYKALAC